MTKPLSRKEREKLKHRQDIMTAALKIFAEKGFHKTTMEDVAKQADFSVGTLYNFFPSKDNLHQKIMEKHLWDYYNQATSIDGSKMDLFDFLTAFLEFELDFCVNNPEFTRLFICERMEEVFVSEESFVEHFKEHVQTLPPFPEMLNQHALLLQSGIEDGLIDQNLSVEDIMEAMRGMVRHFLWLWLADPTRFDLKDKARVITKIFFDGVRRK
ncbi:MAG: TetR/AcrR family transcriptional regulator [Phycisphaerae bacterium]|nr:TetR/AcrR family transcriptional regulator [Phycisphaerae bacterium]